MKKMPSKKLYVFCHLFAITLWLISLWGAFTNNLLLGLIINIQGWSFWAFGTFLFTNKKINSLQQKVEPKKHGENE